MRTSLLVAVLATAGCFQPKIQNGQYTCATSNLCPEGFECLAGQCVLPGTVLSDSGTVVGDMSSADIAPADMGPGVLWNALLGDLDLTGQSGTIEVDTEHGAIMVADSMTVLVAADSPGFSHVAQPNGPPAGVFSFHKLIVPSTVKLIPASSSGNKSVLVVAATDRIEINGAIDWASYGSLGGGPQTIGQSGSSGVASGGQPGLGNSSGSGGGGAGYATAGDPGEGASAGAGGASYGTPTLVPLHQGSGGGGGGGLYPGGIGGVGGNGGGAIALLSRADLVIAAPIDVSGQNGHPGGGASTAPAGGAGGGSGGSLLLSAKSVVLADGHQLRAAGGAGGLGILNGGNGGKGSDGRIWIGGTTVSVAGDSLQSTPTSIVAQGTVVDTFPR